MKNYEEVDTKGLFHTRNSKKSNIKIVDLHEKNINLHEEVRGLKGEHEI